MGEGEKGRRRPAGGPPEKGKWEKGKRGEGALLASRLRLAMPALRICSPLKRRLGSPRAAGTVSLKRPDLRALRTGGIFTAPHIAELARTAWQANDRMGNSGASRLHTMLAARDG